MKKRIIIFSILGIMLFLLPLAVNAEAYLVDRFSYDIGWVVEDGRLYYKDSNKTKVTGDVRIDQIVYSFADDGHLKHMDDYITIHLGNEFIYRTFYVDLFDNLASGLTSINGDTYFFDEKSYHMLTGCVEINGKNYLFAPNLVKNAWRYDYYADKDGIVDKTPGYRRIGDDMYYFDEEGKCVSGFVEIDGEMHFFMHTDGPGTGGSRPAEQRGWVNTGGFFYYFDLSTGVMATGDKVIEGKTYTFYNDGVLKVQNDIEYIDGMFYAFDNSSGLKNGGVIYSSDGNTYYVESGVYSGYIHLNSGWSNIRGRWFYRYEEGGWPRGICEIYDSENDTFTTYVFSESGELLTGWTKIDSNYYLADSNGHIVLGWVYSNGKWFYLREFWETYDQYGSMATGWEYIDSHWYFFDNDGAMCIGWQFINNKWYYFSNSGFMVTGWVNLGSSWYYMDQSGEMCTGWICVDNNWYYLNSDGSMVTGWKKINNRWYYMNADGTMLTGWLSSGNHWYYFNSSGAMVTGWYEEKKGNTSAWYWFDDNGAMVTGWKEINGQWEMFDTNGVWLYTWNGQ